MSSSFVATSGALPADRFPQFRSWPSSRWSKPEGTFGPHTGERFLYSQMADAAYKRLTREVAVPADGPATLSFWAFYDTEPGWDHLIVEARTPGADDWTTLSDANGHTTQDTGQSCPGGWQELHPLETLRLLDYGCAITNPRNDSSDGRRSALEPWHARRADGFGLRRARSITAR